MRFLTSRTGTGYDLNIPQDVDVHYEVELRRETSTSRCWVVTSCNRAILVDWCSFDRRVIPQRQRR